MQVLILIHECRLSLSLVRFNDTGNTNSDFVVTYVYRQSPVRESQD